MLSLNSISYWDLLSYPSWLLFWCCTLPKDRHIKITALVSLSFWTPFPLTRQAFPHLGESMVENKAIPSAPKRCCLVWELVVSHTCWGSVLGCCILWRRRRMLRILCSVGRQMGIIVTQKYCREALGGGLWGGGNTLLGDKQRSLEPWMDRQ